jgi:mannose-6-phosphate isomerase-like protein (cupin superfamily)
MSEPWETKAVADEYDYVSPGGVSEIRLLPSFEQGEVTHARANPSGPSLAATTSGLGEIFYVLSGEGELWRRSGELADVTHLHPGRCVSVPPGIEFQYRALDGPLAFLVATAPRWQKENWHEAATRYWDEQSRVSSPGPLRPGPWSTVDLPSAYDYLAPDGSEIRLLTTYDAGGLAHCRLPAGHVSSPVRHVSVVEIWYVLAGRGEVWRASEAAEEVVEVSPTWALTIPTGTSFQFRTAGDEPLELVIGTFPRWPGPQEAVAVDGHWAAGGD